MEIIVPQKQDSMSRVVIAGEPYYIRFTYNDTEDRWYFGIYDVLKAPITEMLKIVPNFPLNAFRRSAALPKGVFVCISNNDTVSRYGFRDEEAHFHYLEVEP